MIPLFFYIIIFQLTRSRGAWPAAALLHTSTAEFQLTRSRGAWPQNDWAWHRQPYFNSHAHVERDQSRPKRQSHRLYFNSHAHVERDRFKKMALKVWQYFNSHAHVERDRILAVLPADFVDFNSHAHVERDWVLAEHWHRRGNFNSHAHVERDKYLKWQEDHQEISTHTLTWSVTEGKHVLMNVSAFQLTRSRGAWPGLAFVSPT